MYRHQKQLRMRLIFTSILYLLLNVHVNCTSFILNTRKDKKTRSLLTKRKLPSERIKCSSGRYCNYESDGDGSCHSIYYKKKYSKNDGTAEEDTSFCSDCPGGYFAQRQKEWGQKHAWSYSTSCTSCTSKLILKTNNFFLGYLYDLYRHTT